MCIASDVSMAEFFSCRCLCKDRSCIIGTVATRRVERRTSVQLARWAQGKSVRMLLNDINGKTSVKHTVRVAFVGWCSRGAIAKVLEVHWSWYYCMLIGKSMWHGSIQLLIVMWMHAGHLDTAREPLLMGTGLSRVSSDRLEAGTCIADVKSREEHSRITVSQMLEIT